MKLLQGLNFPRSVILVSLASSLVLGWVTFQQRARLTRVEAELRKAPKLVRDIQTCAMRLDDLQRMADKEGLKGEQSDPESYIRRVAQKDRVNIGQVDTAVSVTTPSRGVEDHHFKIKPSSRDTTYTRVQIGNFLYTLEADSRRVKVTSLKITPTQRLKPGELGDDRWTFEAEITSRQAVDG